jgi:hypothetical protein
MAAQAYDQALRELPRCDPLHTEVQIRGFLDRQTQQSIPKPAAHNLDPRSGGNLTNHALNRLIARE